MKTAAKILNIITLISLGLTIMLLVGMGLLFILLPSLNGGYFEDPTGEVIIGWTYGIIMIVYAIPVIIPFVLGILCTVALEKSKNKTTVLVWGIVSVVCFNTISGILMIIYATDDKNFPQEKTHIAPPPVQSHIEVEPEPVVNTTVDLSDKVITKLKNLKQLKDDGIISEEEYEECRKSLVSKL